MRVPSASLVVPLYNKEKFIGRALESAFAQTFEDYEVVVVDDGSTDDSMSVVAGFSDSRLRVIRQANAGPGAARNAGARSSAAELIAFLDADDELLPNFLSRNVANLESRPDCAMSLCTFVRGPGQEVCSGLDGQTIKPGAWRMPADFAPASLRNLCFSMHAYGVARRAEFLRLGGYYENRCLLGEDTYLLLQLLLHCRVYFEPEPLVWYHSENAELCMHYMEDGAADWQAVRKRRPIVPALSNPEGLRTNCPPTYRALLENYLAYEALSEAQTRASVGDFENAQDLRQRFPAMSAFRYDYAKLQLKLALPGASQWMSRLKSAAC